MIKCIICGLEHNIVNNNLCIEKMNKYIKKVKHEYNFYFSSDIIVIFDEAHRCKNWASQSSSLLIAIS